MSEANRIKCSGHLVRFVFASAARYVGYTEIWNNKKGAEAPFSSIPVARYATCAGSRVRTRSGNENCPIRLSTVQYWRPKLPVLYFSPYL